MNNSNQKSYSKNKYLFSENDIYFFNLCTKDDPNVLFYNRI